MNKYISPEACAIVLSFESLIANSPSIDSTQYTAGGGDSNRRTIWNEYEQESDNW